MKLQLPIDEIKNKSSIQIESLHSGSYFIG